MGRVSVKEIVLMLLPCFGASLSAHLCASEEASAEPRTSEEVSIGNGLVVNVADPRVLLLEAGLISAADVAADSLPEDMRGSDLLSDTLATGVSRPGTPVQDIPALESEAEVLADEGLGDAAAPSGKEGYFLWMEGSTDGSADEDSGDEVLAEKWDEFDRETEEGNAYRSALKDKKARSVFAAICSSERGNRKKARHKVAKFVIDNPKLISQDYGNGFTILHGAVLSGDRRLVRFVLNNGANPRAKTYAGYSPLDEALRYDYAGIARDLAERGASYNGELFPLEVLKRMITQKGRACKNIFKVIECADHGECNPEAGEED